MLRWLLNDDYYIGHAAMWRPRENRLLLILTIVIGLFVGCGIAKFTS